MLTTLSGRETNLVFAIMEDMVAIHDARQLRTQIGERLLDLLEADYFASYVWSKADGDTGGVTDALMMLTRNFIDESTITPCVAACEWRRSTAHCRRWARWSRSLTGPSSSPS